MAERLDVLTASEYERNGEKKTTWTRIGVAFPTRNGDGWDVRLEALPVSGKLFLRAPRQRDEAAGGGQRRGGGQPPQGDPTDTW